MDIERLCPGCMTEKGTEDVCPHCGYDEGEAVSPIVLPPRAALMNSHYLVGRVLGKPGGFGITYLAWDVNLETKVAVKEFLPRDLAGRDTDHTTVVPHHTDDKEFFAYGLDRFVQEARTLAKFDHPNVVRVKTFFEENGTAYLVMNYYEGVSLEQYLKDQGGRLDEKLAVKIMLPVMDGLRAVHEKGFLHRDVKPQNIYLTEGGIPILLDFGAARFAMGERSRSLSVVLTPGFAPFEQYHKKGKQGPWTDIYSTAATLYNMVTGKTPPEAADRIMEDDIEPVDRFVPGSSSQLDNALMSGLSVKPEDRPQSIKEFQEILINGKEAAEDGSSSNLEADDVAFNFAKNIGTAEAFQLYLKQFPTGMHSEEVKNILMQQEKKNENIEQEKQEEEVVIPIEPKEPLIFEYKTEDGGIIVLEGALKRQGKEGVLVWEDDSWVKEKFHGAYRNEKGFWEIRILKKGLYDLTMVYVPAGEFIMGNGDSNAYKDEKPAHKVFLDGYWIGKYEITFEQFDVFCKETGLYTEGVIFKKNTPPDGGWGRGKRPVINVSWNDASNFCIWMEKKTGMQFSLPTEAQWEKAAKGTDNRRFPWGNERPSKNLANFYAAKIKKTTLVNIFPDGASPYGVMDMSGNVWEWCLDWYGEDFYEVSPGKNPVGPLNGTTRVKRGGSWKYDERGIHCDYRHTGDPSYRDIFLGFRVCMVNKEISK